MSQYWPHLPLVKRSLFIYELCVLHVHRMLVWRNLWVTSIKRAFRVLHRRMLSLYIHFTTITTKASEARASNEFISCQTRNDGGRWVSKMLENSQIINNTSMIIFKIAIYQTLSITPSLCIWRTLVEVQWILKCWNNVNS